MKRILIICLLTVFAYQSTAQVESEIGFVCPPCGCTQDEEFKDVPHTCSACGMVSFAAFKEGYKAERKPTSNAVEKTVAILLFPGVQIIDYTGPYEVFGQANWDVFTVAKSDEIITTAMGMMVKPHHTFQTAPDADFLLVPGGNVGSALNDNVIMDWVKKEVGRKEQTLSVCNGAYILGDAGLLDNMKATTFAPLIEGLKDVAPKAEVVSDERYTDNGKIITSAGLSSGIDAAIYLVSKYQGVGNAQRLATHLEYDWSPNKGFVRASLADMHLAGFGNFISQFDRELLKYEGNQDQWTVELSVETELSVDQIKNVFAFQAEKGMGWSSDENGSWKFTIDEDQWIAILNIRESRDSKLMKFQVKKEI